MAQEGTSRSSKRQSLLLPRGTLAAANRGQPGPNGNARQRPMSMMGIDAYNARELAAIGENTAAVPRSRADSPTKIQRSVTSISEEQTSNARTEPSRSRTGLSRLPSTRKPAGHSRPQSMALRSPTEEVQNSSSSARSKLPTGSLYRSGSTASRPARTNSGLPTPSSATSTSGGSSRPTSMLLPPSSRPAFNTLQQHYSPRRTTAPKPTSASIIHAPNGTNGATESPTTSTTNAAMEPYFQQTHLLQLALLHASFPTTLNAWSTSARRALARKFADATGHADAVHEQEREAALRANVSALAEWGGSGVDGSVDSGALGDNVQALAGVVLEADVLCDQATGRVGAAVGAFGAWIEAVEEMWAAREEGSGAAAVEFIDGLGEEWREEGKALIRRLSGLLGILDGLERPREGSSVALVMQRVRDILAGSIEELEMVLLTEKLVVRMESDWVDQQLSAMSNGLVFSHGLDKPLTT